MYFVHSYMAKCDNDKNIIATCNYNNIEIQSIIVEGNSFGCQFHPGESGVAGLEIIRKFISIKGVEMSKIIKISDDTFDTQLGKLPKDVVFAINVVSNQRPRIKFNLKVDGQCSACDYVEEKKSIDWEQREKEL